MRFSPDMATEDRIGRTFGGRYHAEEILGRGGFGAVFRATDTETGKPVALKILHAHLAGEREVITRFRREALAATEIGHPGIVEVLEFGREGEDGDAWIAMELLEGEDAGEALKSGGPFSVARLVGVLSEVCDALTAAHGKGVVHRDLKLDNVFLTQVDGAPGPVKLVDFGVSKFLEAIDGASLMTRTGTTLGTPFYMSPEQAQGKKGVDPRADIYALGVIAFKLLTAQHPFEDDSYPMLVLKICTEPPPPVTRYRSDVPIALEAVIERCLAKSPDARFQTCAELKAALVPFADLDVEPGLRKAPRTSDTRASALSSHSMADAPTALSIDPITGEPLVPSLEEEARGAEKSLKGGGMAAWKWVAVLLLVAGGIGAGVLALRQEEPNEPLEERARPLPTSDDPVIRPMRTPVGAELGWRWVNPLPRAMPTWNAVAVGGPGLVAMVGREGRAGRMNGGALSQWATGIESELRAVAWIGPAQAIAVGDEGVVLLLLQSGPRKLETGVTTTLRDVAPLGATDAVAVGDDGMVLRLPGLRPSPLPTGREENLYGVHVTRGERTYAVGQRGIVLRIDGTTVTVDREPSGPALRAVTLCAGALYAVGDDGVVLQRDGDPEAAGTWRRINVTEREDWTDLSCDNGRAVASGDKGGVLMVSANGRSVRFDSGSERGLRGIGGAEDAPTWIVGDGGMLAQLEQSRLHILTAGHTGTLFDVHPLGGAMVAVGAYGAILRFNGERLTVAESPTDAALTGVAMLSEDRLVAVGDHGVVVEITWDAARTVEGAPREYGWRDVVAGGGTIVAVGTDGAFLRGVPGALAVSTLPDVGGLWAIAGTPSEAVAVGDGGAVVSVALAGQTLRARCGEATLRAVSFESTDVVWVAGDLGHIYRVEGGACTLERDGGPNLHALDFGPNGRLIALGSRGASYERAEDGTWAEFELDTDFELQTILRTERDVFIAGAGGVVMRHPRMQ